MASRTDDGEGESRQTAPAHGIDSARSYETRLRRPRARIYALAKVKLLVIGSEENPVIRPRLYLFVVLLRRTRGLGTLIFIETREDLAGRFVGLARADALEGALRQRIRGSRSKWQVRTARSSRRT
jgi:hypothetical protein